MNFKTRPNYMLHVGDLLQLQRHPQNQSEGIKYIFHAIGNQKISGVTILCQAK